MIGPLGTVESSVGIATALWVLALGLRVGYSIRNNQGGLQEKLLNNAEKGARTQLYVSLSVDCLKHSGLHRGCWVRVH